MLYNDLVRLNAIDQDILRQLERLSALYEERASIMQLPARLAQKQPSIPIPAYYEKLKEQWSTVGIDVPKLDAIRRKLTEAVDFITKHHGPDRPDMNIVLIPPERSLLKAMQSIAAPAVDVQSYRDLRIKPNHAWRCVVIQDPAHRQHVGDVRSFLREHPSDNDAFPSLETGAQLTIAAYLQGIPLVETGTWNLLLGDMVSPQEVPCARLVDNRLRFSIDDSAGFLGMNYYYPSITIGFKKKVSGAKKA